MSITTPAVQVPVNDTIGSWLRRHLGWMLTGVAVAAVAVLVTFLVLDGESTVDQAPAAGTTFSAERGSINAIDHGTDSPVSDSGVLNRSIAAIDHHVGGGVKVR
jgi:hypothetical protein